MFDTLLQLDGQLLIWIQNHLRFEFLTPVMKFISALSNGGMIWILLTLVLLILPAYRKTGVLCTIALILDVLLVNVLLKDLAARPRPYTQLSDLVLLIKAQTDFSFPSGHTSCAFSVAWIYFRRLPKKAGIPLLILAFLTGFSRLYVGVHYPTDVLGGFLCGSLIAWTVLSINNRRERTIS